MLSRNKLHVLHCGADLVRVVDQVGLRAAARGPIPFDMPMAALLLFWTVLRDERTFLLTCLEEMGVDMWALTRDVDSLIEQRKAQGSEAEMPAMKPAFADPFVDAWLDRAERESRVLGHRYLGPEHLLLAIVAEPEPLLAEVLSRHGVRHAELEEAIVTAFVRQPPAKVVEVVAPLRPRGVHWDAPAVGVPRRYSLAMILGMTAVYAVLFAALRLLGAGTVVFLVVTVFFTGVIIGQALLFHGQFPRDASIWIGAALFPLEILACIVYVNMSTNGDVPIAAALCLCIACIPLGAGLGYLAGCLGAGMFCVLEWYEKRKHRVAPPAESASGDPFEKDE